MVYSDVVIRVYVDVLGPLYVLPGPVVDGIHFYRCEGCPGLRVCPGS